jgi:hypothetical protein
MDRYPERRRFLKLGSIAVVAVLGGKALAQTKGAGKGSDKGLQRLSESDPQAVALGYKEDATKADRKKFPSYQPGQTCANCQQYQGSAADARAPCVLFPGKTVAAKGWCAAWVKKA